MQDHPAPSCGGGIRLGRAAGDWLKAATAYLSAEQILASSPVLGSMSSVDQSNPDIGTGNRGLSHAQTALKRAVRKSRGLIKNIIKRTGTAT